MHCVLAEWLIFNLVRPDGTSLDRSRICGDRITRFRSYWLCTAYTHGAHEEHEDAFTDAAGTPHVGGLWDCPLVYSTSIAPSQRVTAQAFKSRVSEYCTASVHKERRALLRYGCSVLGTSCAKSLMLGIVHTPSSGQPQRVE